MKNGPSSRQALITDWARPRPRPRRRVSARAVAVAAVGAAAVAIAVLPSLIGGGWRPPSGMSGFASCSLADGLSGWCASVRVPENRAVSGSRTIALRVAVLPSSRRPARGALFYLEGGPGHAATAAAGQVNEMFARVTRDRDVVMIDQRGTGGSHALTCGSATILATDERAVSTYVRRCFARLGNVPRLYGTSAAADDVESVRRALGYGRIDVYGGSYGATLAQVFAARHPRSVRSMVLDAASLLDVPLYERSAASAQHALAAIVARCNANRACAAAYPHTMLDVRRLLERPARRVTVELGEPTIGPDQVASTLDVLSRSPGEAASIPYVVHAAAANDYVPLARAYVAHQGTALEPAAQLAMFWAILCTEPWAASDPAATARAGRGSYFARAAVSRARVFTRACRSAALPPVHLHERPTRAPVLLLAGGADPLDPVVNLRGWRRVFPHGRLVVVRDGGHGSIDGPCIERIVTQFVGRPAAGALDTSCVRRIPAPPFVIG